MVVTSVSWLRRRVQAESAISLAEVIGGFHRRTARAPGWFV